MIRTAQKMTSEKRTEMRGGNGDVTITHLFTKDELSSHTRLCAKLTIPPKCSIGFHQHLDEEEVFYILKGRAEVDDDGTIYEVNPDDAILTGNGAGHSLTCISDEPLEVLAVIGTF